MNIIKNIVVGILGIGVIGLVILSLLWVWASYGYYIIWGLGIMLVTWFVWILGSSIRAIWYVERKLPKDDWD